jgi:Trypsin-like peptidase domain
MEHAVPIGPAPAAQRAAGAGRSAATGSVVASGAAGARGVVARDTGKVFFDLDGTDYVCSGAVVGGPRVSVVVTAAHCVTDGYSGWATHWEFVPGYAGGAEPYGSYSARRFFVSRQWDAGLDETYDVAFVTVGGLSGGLPVRFDTSPRSAYVFGYPADSPFSGGSLRYCAGPVSQDSQDPGADSGIRCEMTAGDSGGPWLTSFQPGTGKGNVVAISTFKYSDDNWMLYGAVLGHVARELYQEALAATGR